MNLEQKIKESIEAFRAAVSAGDLVAANKSLCMATSFGANPGLLRALRIEFNKRFGEELIRQEELKIDEEQRNRERREATIACATLRIPSISFDDFTCQRFQTCPTDGLSNLCDRLAELIWRELTLDQRNWAPVFRMLIERMKNAGHDLAGFDDNGDEGESWCTNYTKQNVFSIGIAVSTSQEAGEKYLSVCTWWKGENGRGEGCCGSDGDQ